MKRRIDDFDRYIEQNKLMTKLKERNYIAQKLHDHLGHRITSSIMQLEVTKETIGTNNEISMKYLESAMSNLREGMEEIREFLRNIKPTEKLVRVEDIKDMIFEFQYNTSIKCKFILEGQIDHISSRMMQVFNDNIKESLTNISKYANATEAIVGIYIYNKVIRVEVRDNGIGCEKVNQDLGFKGMKERLREINGVLNYYNDNGFVVSMLVRLEDNNEY